MLLGWYNKCVTTIKLRPYKSFTFGGILFSTWISPIPLFSPLRFLSERIKIYILNEIYLFIKTHYQMHCTVTVYNLVLLKETIGWSIFITLLKKRLSSYFAMSALDNIFDLYVNSDILLISSFISSADVDELRTVANTAMSYANSLTIESNLCKRRFMYI